MPAKNINDQAVFEAARKIESREARQAYLSQTCGDDPAMEQRVSALLRAYEESPGFLESPAPELGQAVQELVIAEGGAVIGTYKLLQPLGDGGMGVVYMAEQTEPVQRRVALKIIKPGMDTRQVIARFEAERQALALMDHPNIAKVFATQPQKRGRATLRSSHSALPRYRRHNQAKRHERQAHRGFPRLQQSLRAVWARCRGSRVGRVGQPKSD